MCEKDIAGGIKITNNPAVRRPGILLLIFLLLLLLVVLFDWLVSNYISTHLISIIRRIFMGRQKPEAGSAYIEW